MTPAPARPSLGHDPHPHIRAARAPLVKKVLVGVGVFVGSAIGWKLGEAVGIMTAYMVSCVGSGLGAYAGILVARELE